MVKAPENSAAHPEKEDEQEITDAQLAKEMFRKTRLIEDAPEISGEQHAGLWKVSKKQKKSGCTSCLPGVKRKLEGTNQ